VAAPFSDLVPTAHAANPATPTNAPVNPASPTAANAPPPPPSNAAALSSAPAPPVSAAGRIRLTAIPVPLTTAPKGAIIAPLQRNVAVPMSAPVRQARPVVRRFQSATDGHIPALETAVPPTAILALMAALALALFAPLTEREPAPPVSAVRCCR